MSNSFLSNLMIVVCGHICFLNWRIGLLRVLIWNEWWCPNVTGCSHWAFSSHFSPQYSSSPKDFPQNEWVPNKNNSIRKTHLIEIDIHRVLPPTSTVRLFCTRDRFATPSVDAAVEKGFYTQRVQAVVKKAPERNQNERRGPLSNLSNNFKSEPLHWWLQ